MLSPSKQKLTTELMNLSSAKQSHRANFEVSLERRVIDGVAKVFARLNDYGMSGLSSNESYPLREEYTDIEKFAKEVHNLIITAASAV